MQIIINIPKEVNVILNILNENGHEAYIVGGCVRDSILNKNPIDWDITTSANPDEIKECFKSFRTIDTGLKHGTVTVLVNNKQFEVTAYRVDGKYTDNRHPDEVQFTNNLSLDLSRRDFTINAMAYNKDGIVDLFGGMEDIENKYIKTVGNPDTRFNEDGLRILRALRFASVLCYSIEENTSLSIHRNKQLLSNISKERINIEFNKLLTGDNFYNVMLEYKNVLAIFIKKLNHIDYKLWIHILTLINNVDNNLILRMTILFYEIYIETEDKLKIIKELKQLKYDNSLIENVYILISYYNVKLIPDSKYIKRLLNKIGEKRLKQLLEIKKAYKKTLHPDNENALNTILNAERIIKEIHEQNQCYSFKDLAVDGNDIKQTGIKEGILVGEILNKLLNMVIDDEIINDKKILMDYIKENYL